MRRLTLLPALAPALLATLSACGGGGGATPLLSIPFDPAAFAGGPIDNPFHPLPVGTTYVYEGVTEDGFERVVVEVTAETKVILGVTCVVVRATETIDDEVVEETDDWFAQDDDGNVWYFGEATVAFEDGGMSTEGSWEAGVDGAAPGIVMLADPFVGATYAQESAPGVAEDRARVVGLDESESTPYGDFDGCVHTEDFTPLEPGVVEDKFYAPGVGLILEVDEDDFRIELVDVLP
jgi:hypothetical protein